MFEKLRKKLCQLNRYRSHTLKSHKIPDELRLKSLYLLSKFSSKRVRLWFNSSGSKVRGYGIQKCKDYLAYNVHQLLD